ncbi:MAG: PEP-CTERM sorting domain-containing protein, partial [Verrucomicrobiia bacterium]
ILTHCFTPDFLQDSDFMKAFFASTLVSIATLQPVLSGLISAVPGPDDQGGMIMPMVTIHATAGPATNPTAGNIVIGFSPTTTPILRPLTEWKPGDWFADTAAWRSDLSPIDGSVAGMPSANAGNGALFNNQYGFMFMAMGTMMMANIPSGNSLAIRLDSISSTDLKSFNYGNAANRWDQVFPVVSSQVLWNGTMWHNYFTMPAGTTPGIYNATFEIFLATTPFTGTTGFAQYDAAAASAVKNPNFNAATVTYFFEVVPEPSTSALFAIGSLSLLGLRRRVSRRKKMK